MSVPQSESGRLRKVRQELLGYVEETLADSERTRRHIDDLLRRSRARTLRAEPFSPLTTRPGRVDRRDAS